jgi:hypothetical protein
MAPPQLKLPVLAYEAIGKSDVLTARERPSFRGHIHVTCMLYVCLYVLFDVWMMHAKT